MSGTDEIARALASITATLNAHSVEELDPDHVQPLVDDAIGQPGVLTLDPGGGLHDRSGLRVGAVRRSPSGEWIADRQNVEAERADTAVPRASEER
jgi:hypothetical protein